MRSKLFLIVFALLASGTLAAAQTDVGLSLYGAFSGRTDANGVGVSPANSAGGIIELRHLANPIFGFEGTYSYNRANERYSSVLAIACPTPPNPCPPTSASIRANAHEITLDWVPSLKVANFRPVRGAGRGRSVRCSQKRPDQRCHQDQH